MPTVREDKLADVIIENATSDRGMTAKQMLVKAGYDTTTAEASPGRVMKQDGVREALIAKGFTVDRADEVVTEILNTGENQHRLKAADMIYERHGAKAPQKTVSLNLTADMKDFEQFDEMSKKYDEEMKRKMRE